MGVGVSLAVVLTAGTAALTLASRRRASDGPLARSLRGAGDLVDSVSASGGCAGRGRSASSCGSPREVLVVAVALAACGWVLDSRIAIVSELPRLVPQSLAAVRDLDALQSRDRRRRARSTCSSRATT